MASESYDDPALSSSQALPQPPNTLFNIPSGSVVVQDADEEIMELYMSLLTDKLPEGNSGGLGYLNPTEQELDLTIEIDPTLTIGDSSVYDHMAQPPVDDPGPSGRGLGQSDGKSKSGSRSRRSKKEASTKSKKLFTIDLHVIQDPAALRARAGDTGSVLWRSSLHLARHILTQSHFPPTLPSLPLLDATRLSQSSILELGAGTGVLASLLAPLTGHYVATDRKENCKLVQRNIDANSKTRGTESSTGPGKAAVQELDWEHVAAERAKWDRRLASHSHPTPSTTGRGPAPSQPYMAPEANGVDLILAVDCIYNENLVQPLVDTLASLCAGGAVAWVVVELRSSDVLTLFLDTWLNDPAGFTITRLGDGAMGSWNKQRPRWVGWVGWIEGAKERMA